MTSVTLMTSVTSMTSKTSITVCVQRALHSDLTLFQLPCRATVLDLNRQLVGAGWFTAHQAKYTMFSTSSGHRISPRITLSDGLHLIVWVDETRPVVIDTHAIDLWCPYRYRTNQVRYQPVESVFDAASYVPPTRPTIHQVFTVSVDRGASTVSPAFLELFLQVYHPNEFDRFSIDRLNAIDAFLSRHGDREVSCAMFAAEMARHLLRDVAYTYVAETWHTIDPADWLLVVQVICDVDHPEESMRVSEWKARLDNGYVRGQALQVTAAMDSPRGQMCVNDSYHTDEPDDTNETNEPDEPDEEKVD